MCLVWGFLGGAIMKHTGKCCGTEHCGYTMVFRGSGCWCRCRRMWTWSSRPHFSSQLIRFFARYLALLIGVPLLYWIRMFSIDYDFRAIANTNQRPNIE